jgi:hypothetical protein
LSLELRKIETDSGRAMFCTTRSCKRLPKKQQTSRRAKKGIRRRRNNDERNKKQTWNVNARVPKINEKPSEIDRKNREKLLPMLPKRCRVVRKCQMVTAAQAVRSRQQLKKT